MSERGNKGLKRGSLDIYRFDGKNYFFSLKHLILQKLIANCATKVLNLQHKCSWNWKNFWRF